MFLNTFGRPLTSSSSVARSLRVNRADSAYLNRTPGVAGNRQKNTHSFWVKRTGLGTFQRVFTAYGAATDNDNLEIAFNTSDQIVVLAWNTVWRVTNRVFRDPSAWYHIVVAIDTTLATANNRIRIYVNGVEETSFGTLNNPGQNGNLGFCAAALHRIGIAGYASSDYFDGYLADVRLIDGLQLDPTSFGETSSATGQWVPKAYTGSYGTTGYWLSFANNASTTTLGLDDAGGAAGAGAGSNDWTLNAFSVTAGVGNDSLTDTPTNNHCTLNPLTNINAATLTNGGLYTAAVGASGNVIRGTQNVPSSGLVYFEATFVGTPSSGTGAVGVIDFSTAHTNSPNSIATVPSTMWLWRTDGFKINAGVSSALGSISTGQVAMVAVDRANNKVWFGANGTWFGSGDPAAGTNAAYTNLTGDIAPCVNFQGTAGTPTWEFNFGQRPFAHTPPTGFVSLCAQNLPTPSIIKPSQFFDIDLYTGTGATRTKTGLGFQPDLVWFKGRSGATAHALYDSARGVQKELEAQHTADETTQATGLTAFTSDGYTIGTLAKLNTNAATYAAWCWKESVTAGLDIVTYTGAGAGTVAHNLGVAPSAILVKARTTAGADQTIKCYHSSLANTEALDISIYAAKITGTSLWNSTAPTASVFSVGGTNATAGDTYVAYCFAEVSGFSRFGQYTGNGSADGPFVWCGFRPEYVVVRRADATPADTLVYDAARDRENVVDSALYWDGSNAESTVPAFDFLSNGFKVRASNANLNVSGVPFVYLAFAEAPFKYANAR